MSPFVRYPAHLIAVWTVLWLAALPVKAEGIFTIGTGSVVGLYYKTAAEICRNFNETKEAHQPKCHTLTTGGSLDNLEALKRKEIDIAIVQADLVEGAITRRGVLLAARRSHPSRGCSLSI